ncbi:MAG: nitrogenase component 1 [Elusimicrobiota bacterium]
MSMKLVVFGKGGIGKSTACSNLAAAYSAQGKKVLLVGCDPKHDTTINLTDGKPIKTAVELSGFLDLSAKREQLVVRGRLGVDCIESGGPEPGIGCAGRGISRTIEMMESCGMMSDDAYDVMIFDVLGDVVCGGFAAPLKLGFADKVVIVASEEMMALYACNNICRAIVNYASNGIGLCGIIANLKDHSDEEESAGTLVRFTQLIHSNILTYLPRDLEVRKAEYERRTVVDYNPRAAFSRKIGELADILWELDVAQAKMPVPLSDREFLDLSRREFKGERREHAPGRAPQAYDDTPDIAVNRAAAAPLAASGRQKLPPPAKEDDRLEKIMSVWAKAKDKKHAEGPHGKVWGDPEQWRQFFADRETWRSQEQQMYLDAPIVGVSHEDLECNYASPYYDDGHMVPFNVPWAARWKTQKRRSDDYLCISTDIVDTDVMAGGSGKLKEALDMAMDNLEGKQAVIVTSTCVPTVIGDDTPGLVARYRKKTNIPIIYNNPSADHYEDPMEVLFQRVKASKEFRGCKPQPRRVNLIGFPPGRPRDELKFLLENAGIDVNVCLLPRFSVEDAVKLRRAGLNVFYPDPAFQTTYSKLFADVDLPGITPTAPYGLRGTRRWLMEVAQKCGGKEASAAEAWSLAASLIAKDWTAGRERIAQRRLGFVVDADKVHRLAGPTGAAGVPLVGMLKEMGFGIDYLAYVEGTAPKLPRAKIDSGSRHRIRWFRERKELHRLLQENGPDAVYSEYFFDRRLTRAGVPQFSLLDVEMGLRGARRSLQRLERICRWELYKRCAEPRAAARRKK